MTEAVTTQSATGLARGKFDRVSFMVNIEGKGANGPQAKAKAQAILTENVKTALNKLKKAGVTFAEDDSQTNFSVAQHFTYDQKNGENRPSGYKADYSMHLETSQVDRVSEIQDVLTSVESISVGNPQFMLQPENRRKLQKVAVTEAFKVVQDRFKEECGVLDLTAEDFEILEWNTQYSDQRHGHRQSVSNFEVAKAYSASNDAGGGAPEMGVQSGLAAVQVTLSVGFRRKFVE